LRVDGNFHAGRAVMLSFGRYFRGGSIIFHPVELVIKKLISERILPLTSTIEVSIELIVDVLSRSIV